MRARRISATGIRENFTKEIDKEVEARGCYSSNSQVSKTMDEHTVIDNQECVY